MIPLLLELRCLFFKKPKFILVPWWMKAFHDNVIL